ncbi:hypothetical protein A2U01_0077960, partial [Trifolium medium]|nr:hypothetical protein [Trifolium medium]
DAEDGLYLSTTAETRVSQQPECSSSAAPDVQPEGASSAALDV